MALEGIAENSGSGTSITVTPSGASAGRVAVAILAVKGGSNVNFVAGTGIPSGWSSAGTPRVNNGSNVAYIPFWKVLAGGDSYTWTITSSRVWAIQVRIYSGISTTGPIGAANGQSVAFGTASTAPSITLPAAGMEIIHVAVHNRGITGGAAWTPPSGFGDEEETASGSNTTHVTLATTDQVFAGSGATGAQAGTWTESAVGVGAMIALMPSSAAVSRSTAAVTAAVQVAPSLSTAAVTVAVQEVEALSTAAVTAAVSTPVPLATEAVTVAVQVNAGLSTAAVTAAVQVAAGLSTEAVTAAVQVTVSLGTAAVTAAVQETKALATAAVTASIDVPGGATSLSTEAVTAAVQVAVPISTAAVTAAVQASVGLSTAAVTVSVSTGQVDTAGDMAARWRPSQGAAGRWRVGQGVAAAWRRAQDMAARWRIG